MVNVQRPLWSYFISSTPSAQLRRVAYAAPVLLFGISAAAIVRKQSVVRNALYDEAATTADRIDRRAYVALPDGRMAQVHPYVNVDFTVSGLWNAFKETFSALP